MFFNICSEILAFQFSGKSGKIRSKKHDSTPNKNGETGQKIWKDFRREEKQWLAYSYASSAHMCVSMMDMANERYRSDKMLILSSA